MGYTEDTIHGILFSYLPQWCVSLLLLHAQPQSRVLSRLLLALPLAAPTHPTISLLDFFRDILLYLPTNSPNLNAVERNAEGDWVYCDSVAKAQVSFTL